MNIVKILTGVLITGIILFASYFFILLKGDDTRLIFSDTLLKNSSAVSTDLAMGQLLNVESIATQLTSYLTELDSAHTDVSFFESDEFESLDNFKRPVPTLRMGSRGNPFQ